MQYAPKNQRGSSTTHHGAALLFALAAVLIISLLILGIGRLIAAHAEVGELSRGTARAYYLAEAAANWQLNRMSRSDLPGAAPPTFGRLSYEEASKRFVGKINGLEGEVDVAVYSSKGLGNDWAPPGDFLIYAIGTDPDSGIKRGVTLRGTGVGLGERYALFAADKLILQSVSDGQGGYLTPWLKEGYIGSNGLIQKQGPVPPTASLPSSGGRFAGCRLGPSGAIDPAPVAGSGWTAGWDMPRLPDDIRWPTVDDVVAYVWKGASVNSLTNIAANKNAQIEALSTGNIVTPVYSDRLRNYEFDNSTYSWKNPQTGLNENIHVIRLRAVFGTTNVFYFKEIQMRSNDFLVLDLRQPPTNSAYQPTSIRIIVDNNQLSNPTRITNLVYYQANDPAKFITTPAPSFLWFNNTNLPIQFEPAFPPGLLEAHPSEKFNYEIIPDVRGFVYGVNKQPAASGYPNVIKDDTDEIGNGDIEIIGSHREFPVTINAAIAHKVRIKGNVTVAAQYVEQPNDPNRYVLGYRVLGNLYEIDPNNITSGRKEFFGYGKFK